MFRLKMAYIIYFGVLFIQFVSTKIYLQLINYSDGVLFIQIIHHIFNTDCRALHMFISIMVALLILAGSLFITIMVSSAEMIYIY